MSFPLRGSVYRERKSSQGQALWAAKPALTRFPLPDCEAANREMTHLKLTGKKRSWVGTSPVQPLATNSIADRQMGLVPKKRLHIVRYERIRHLVIPIFASLNRHG